MTLEPGIYVNYKSDDKKYEILGVGRNTETGEEYAVYRPLYEIPDHPEFCIRPIEMFLGTVAVGDQIVPRFRRVEE